MSADFKGGEDGERLHLQYFFHNNRAVGLGHVGEGMHQKVNEFRPKEGKNARIQTQTGLATYLLVHRIIFWGGL